MREKPRLNVFRNFRQAWWGFKDAWQHEAVFRVELICISILFVVALLLPLPWPRRVILALSLFLVPVAEIINTALERVVDLVTLEFHDLAKRAKDLGSTLVVAAILVVAVIWGAVLGLHFSGN